MKITIYNKSNKEIASVVVGSNSYVLSQIMGDNYLQLEFTHGSYIKFKRDCYCVYNGIRYTLRESVKVVKHSTCEYEYSGRWEAPQEMLENVIMSHMAGENQVTTKQYERNFSLAGTAKEHLMMLWRNTDRLNATFSEPTDSDIDSSLTGVKVVAYNVVSCKSALQLIANAFECEWWVSGNETDGYTMHLGKCSFDESNPTALAYGYDQGVLPDASRELHKDAQRMTHIAVQGGTQNINTLSQLDDVPAYKFSTLHLPRTANTNSEGVGTIYYDVKNNKFSGETGFSMNTAVLLTIDRDANTMTSSLYDPNSDNVIERAYDLSEYYPKKVRKVTSWGFQNNNTEFYIIDANIENKCNYKTYQLGGEKITIEFQSGALAGKSFDVIKYDHNTRKFVCSVADYDTISMPSASDETDMWRPTENDEFIVFGCALPSSYFADRTTDPYSGAEWDMCRRTASILCENFEDKFAYSLTIDSNWLSRRTEAERAKLKVGYWVHYTDAELCGGGIDIRITDVKQYLTRPLQPEITIGDEVKTISVAQKLTQIQSNVSATASYVQQVQQETQQAIQKVEESKVENLQSDWEETDETSSAYIKNKPTIPEGSSVIDNLTSTDATASLSANQGRVLKGLVDNKASKTHSHAWGDITNKPIYSLSNVIQHIDWIHKDDLPNVNTLLFWNGAWDANGSSSLKYCYRGLFGTIVTKNIEDYSPADHTHTWESITDKPELGNIYSTAMYISDISAQGSVFKYAFSVPTNLQGVLKTGDYIYNINAMWRVDHIANNVGYCKNAGVQHTHTWDAITDKPIDTEWGDAGTQSDSHLPSTKLVYDGLNGFVELITNTNTRVNNKADKTELNAYVKTTDLDSNYYNKTSIDLAVGMLQKKNDFINFKLGGSYANWQVSEVEQHGGLSVLDISRSTSGQSNYNLCIGITNRTTITNYNNYLLNHRCVVTCTMFNSDGSVKQVDALGSVSSFKNFSGTCFIWIIFNTNVVDPDFSSDPDAYNYFAVKFEPIN